MFDVDDLIFDPGIADEIPALRLLPPDEAELWLEGVQRYRTTMEACDAYIGSTPRARRARPRRRGHRRAPVRERGRQRARRGQRHRHRPPAPPGAAPGRATSAAPPPTTTTGATSRRRWSSVLAAPRGRALARRAPPAHGQPCWRRSATGCGGSRSRRGRRCPRCCATSTSTSRPSNRAAGSTTPRAPSSGWRPPWSAPPPSPARRRRSSTPSTPGLTRLARGRPVESWPAILDRALRRRRRAHRRRRPGTPCGACSAGRPTEQGRRYLEILERGRRRPARPRGPRRRWTPLALDEPMLATRAQLEPYPVPLEGSIGWKAPQDPATRAGSPCPHQARRPFGGRSARTACGRPSAAPRADSAA